MEVHGDKIGDTRECFSHHITWSKDHPTVAEMEKLLFSYDTLATEALDRLDEIVPPVRGANKCPMARDTYALLQAHAPHDETIGKFWDQISTVPDWVDWEQIARGQRVVYQYNAQILLGLLIRSLVGGMGAFRIVETLARTGGFGVEVTRRRLLETFQHFMECVEDLDAVKPGGKGYVSSVRVRLLHTTVRRRIMKLEAQRPGYFSTEEWGLPINDLHQMATISVYSASIAMHTLTQVGVHLTRQQIDDYLALWRWIGYVMGTPIDWMETQEKARAFMESVMVCEVRPNEKSVILANNILTAEAGVPPLYISRQILAAHSWIMNGGELSSKLGIERPGWYWMLRANMQYCTFMYFSCTYQYLPRLLQARRDRYFLRIAQQMITDRKIGGLGKLSQFNFQYEPNLDKTTEEMGDWRKLTANSSWGSLLLVVTGMAVTFGVLAAVLAAVMGTQGSAVRTWPSEILGALLVAPVRSRQVFAG